MRWSYAMKCLVAAVVLVSSLAVVTPVRAQAAIAQPFVSSPTVAPNTPVQQPQVTLPNVVNTISSLRGAGLGAGGFTRLCDDPLDPRQFTEECNAAGIGQ
jgi:hypothetical protein